MATIDDVFELLKAVNEVTLKRMEDQSQAVSEVTTRMEDQIKGINEVTLKRMEDQIKAVFNLLKAVNEVTLTRMEDQILAIKTKVGA
jgi:hypothetical protein